MEKDPQNCESTKENRGKDTSFDEKREEIDRKNSLLSDSGSGYSSDQEGKLRFIPVSNSRYVQVWRRAKVKLRSKASVRMLQKDLNLYGTSLDVPGQPNRREFITRSRRASISDPVPTIAERNQAVQHHWYILKPESNFKRAWNFVITLILLYTAIVVPYRAALLDLEETPTWLRIDVVTNCLFFLDIWVNLFSSYYTNEGELIVSWRLIAKRYAKTWLLCDVVSSFPFYLMERSSSDYANVMRLARVPRLYRLFRLSRLFKFLKNSDGCLSWVQEVCQFNHNALRLFAFTVSILGAVHIAACLWCALPSIEGSEDQSWVSVQRLMDADPGDVYIAGFYWAFTTLTTVGYGDISPGTILEKCFSILWMLFGICFYSFAIGSFTSLISKIDTKETILSLKLAIIDEFARNSKITPSLKFHLKKALQYSTEKSAFSWITKHAIFNELPKKLKYDLAMSMHQGSAQRFTFFTEKSREFVAFTVPFLIPMCVYPQEFIYKKGDYAGEIYFLEKGTCALAIKHLEKWVMLRKMNDGGYFGDIEVMAGVEREHSYRAINQCDFLLMSKALVRQVQNEFPNIYNEMRKIAEIRKEMNDASVKMFQKSRKGESSNKTPTTSSSFSAKLHMIQTEISRSSDHYHFPTKDEMKSSIDHSRDSLQRMSQMNLRIKSILDSHRSKLRDKRLLILRPTRSEIGKELMAISEMEDTSVDYES